MGQGQPSRRHGQAVGAVDAAGFVFPVDEGRLGRLGRRQSVEQGVEMVDAKDRLDAVAAKPAPQPPRAGQVQAAAPQARVGGQAQGHGLAADSPGIVLQETQPDGETPAVEAGKQVEQQLLGPAHGQGRDQDRQTDGRLRHGVFPWRADG